MRRFITLALALVFTASGASAEPTIKGPDKKLGNSVYEYEITFDSSTDDSDAMRVGGVCFVSAVYGGAGAVSLYQVPEQGTATGSGTLVGAAISATTTAPTKFNPGMPYVKAVAGTASSGTIMTVRCTHVSLGGGSGGVLGEGPLSEMTASSPSAGDLWLRDDAGASLNCTTEAGANDVLCMYTDAGAWVNAGNAGASAWVGTATSDLGMGAYDITLDAASTVDGRDVSTMEDDATNNGSQFVVNSDTGVGNEEYDDELQTIFDALAQQTATHNQSEMVVQFECGEPTIQNTVVLGVNGDTGTNGIIVQGCGMGHAAAANPRSGTEIRWEGAANGTMFQIGSCADEWSTPSGSGPQTSGSTDGYCDSDGVTLAPRTKGVTFRDIAFDCSGTFTADHAFELLGSGQNVTFERVSFHDCDDSAIQIGGSDTAESGLQFDTVSFNDVYWDQTDVCIRNSATNAVGLNVNGGRCRYDVYGYDIVGGDINTSNHVMEGRSGSTAAFRFNDAFKPSTIVGTIVDSAGPGIVTQGTASTAQNLTIMGSRLSTTTTNGDVINYQLGGFLTLIGNKFAGTGGATGIDIVIDPDASITQDMQLYWANNFLATSVDEIVVDYEGTADVIASGPGVTAADCSAPSPAFGTGTSGFVRGTVCTEAGGDQYYCSATDTMCLNNDWTLLAGGGDVATDAIWTALGDLAVGTGVGTATVISTGTATQYLIGGAVPAWTTREWSIVSGIIRPATDTFDIAAGFDGSGTAVTDFGFIFDESAGTLYLHDALNVANVTITDAGAATFAGAVSAASFSSDPSDTAELRLTSATGGQDIAVDLTDNGTTSTMDLTVDDSGGTDVVYIQLDGANETVDISQPITFNGTGALPAASVNGATMNFSHFESAVLESPADADNFNLFKTPYAITITGIDCVVDPADTGESVVITVQERDGNADTPAGVDGATTITCGNTNTADDGSLSNAGIDAGDWVSLDIGTVTGTVTQLSVTIEYTVN